MCFDQVSVRRRDVTLRGIEPSSRTDSPGCWCSVGLPTPLPAVGRGSRVEACCRWAPKRLVKVVAPPPTPSGGAHALTGSFGSRLASPHRTERVTAPRPSRHTRGSHELVGSPHRTVTRVLPQPPGRTVFPFPYATPRWFERMVRLTPRSPHRTVTRIHGSGPQGTTG